MSHLDYAQKAASSGLAVLPIQANKKPDAAALLYAGFHEGKWKELQGRLASESEILALFSNGSEFALICGAVSGNLECLDFDVPGKHEPGFVKGKSPVYHDYATLLKDNGAAALLKSLTIIETPSGGRHILYRCTSKVDGNQKIAYDPQISNEALIETKGEGGYIATFPTPGYRVLQGDLLDIQTIDADQREFLLSFAYLFSKEPVNPEPKAYKSNPAITRPGDRFNATADWASILKVHGWQTVREVQGRTQWVRPGKEAKDGISATTGNHDDLLFVFTSNAPPFQPGTGYSKFTAYTLLNFHGDFMMAAQSVNREQKAIVAYSSPGWRKLSDVQKEPVTWLWKPIIPKSALSMVQGDPGSGKSTITRAIAAAMTVGGKLPSGELVTPSEVIMLACEDSPEKVLVQKFEDMGADLTKISLIEVERDDGETVAMPPEAAIEFLEDRIVGVNAKLVVIDPIVEYLGSQIDMGKQNQVRPFLAKLRNLAERHGIPIILVHHLNKSAASKPIYRSVGSIDFVAACRSVLMVGEDPEDKTIRAMAHIKSNWGPLGGSYGFVIDTEGQFRWDGQSKLTADRMIAPPVCLPSSPGSRQSCKEWLDEVLSVGIPIASAELFKDAAECGYSKRTVWNAKELMPHIRTRKVGAGWEWYVEDLSHVYRGGD